MRVFLLGSTGMIGSAIVRQLRNRGNSVVLVGGASGEGGWRFTESSPTIPDELEMVSQDDYVVNCVGLVKSEITQAATSTASAIYLNAILPIQLSRLVARVGARLVHVTTDCVYSGARGDYSESDPHDATDVYGQTKSLGEVSHPNVMNLRVSQVGPELTSSRLLLEWLRSQPHNARIDGFTNHAWNGISSDAFGRIVSAICAHGLFEAGSRHIVPNDKVSKFELVTSIAARLGRQDIEVTAVAAATYVDRTLATEHPDFNSDLWLAAGFGSAPSVERTLDEIDWSALW